MKRVISILGIVCLLGAAAYAQKASPKSLFFVIDVSGSMQKNQIFEPLKNEIIKYIKTEAEKGDFVSIITFGTDVKLIAGEKISEDNTATNIALLVERVSKLTAKEQYTHMTRALDLLASQMGLIKAANPQGMVKAFLFTDGKNEPPPNAEGSQWTFDEILKKHYNVFDNPATYLFIITLGIQPDEELVKAAEGKKDKIFINTVPDVTKLEEKNIIPKELPQIAPPPVPFVALEMTGPDEIKAGKEAQYKLKVMFKEAKDGAEGKKLPLMVELSPENDFSTEKGEVTIMNGGEETFPIIIKSPAVGSYTLKIRFQPREEMKIEPAFFELKFGVRKPDRTLLFVLIALLAGAGAVFLFVKSIPRFSDDYLVVNPKEGLSYSLKEKQKWYSSSISSRDLGISDADFKLSMNKKTGEVAAKVLQDGEWKEIVLNSGDVIVDPYRFEIKIV